MKQPQMMIDYRDDNDNFVRKVIDNYEFCIRDETAYFISEGVKMQVPMQKISQVYTY